MNENYVQHGSGGHRQFHALCLKLAWLGKLKHLYLMTKEPEK